MAVGNTVEQRETGDRMIGGGAQFQVSGLGHQVPDSGAQVRVQVQEIGHLSSAIDPVIFPGGRWQLQVPGGGKSVLCPLSSIQSSVIGPAIHSSLHSAPFGHYSNCYGCVTGGKHLRDGLAATCHSSTHII